MGISFRLVLAGTIVVGLGVGAGFAAYQSAGTQAAPAGAAASASGGANAAAAQFDTGQASQQQGARPTMGVVEKVGDKEFSVKAGSSAAPVTVRVNDQTTIRLQVAGTLSDIKQGERISVRGEPGAGDTIAATSIQLVAAGTAGPQVQMGTEMQSRGGRTQSGGQPERDNSSQGTAGAVMGTVESVANNVITLASAAPSGQGKPVKITVSDKTTITKMGTGELKDVAEGASVTVIGQKGADGAVVASSVQILPPEAAQMMRRQ